MFKAASLLLTLAAAAFSLVGCGKNTPPKQAKQTAAVTKAQTAPKEPAIIEQVGGNAAVVFRARCSTCHGIGGKGDGAASASLNPKPRDLTSKEWQASVKDDHIRKIIIGGGQAVGMSATMTANPDLKDKPEIVNGLVKIIRGLK